MKKKTGRSVIAVVIKVMFAAVFGAAIYFLPDLWSKNKIKNLRIEEAPEDEE